MNKSNHRMGRKKCFFFVLFFIAALSLWGQNTTVEERISTTVFAETAIPVFGDEELFSIGYGGSAAFEYALLPFLMPLLHGSFHVLPVHGLDPLTLLDAGIGVGLRIRLFERLTLRADLLGGTYVAQWRDYGTSGLFFGVRAKAGYKISPALTLSLHGGYFDYLSDPDPFLQSIAAGASINFHFSEFGKKNAKIDIQTKNVDPIFPVFYSYYDENTFGSVEIINEEKGKIRDVSVSLLVPEYMSGPRECGYSEELAVNERMAIPLFTLLNDEVLELTENTKAQAVISVNYRFMGVKREADIPMELTMYHRNAMTWDDDKKAAAFVSPTDPAVLWFSRFASGIASNRMRGSINRNLQQAMAIFEALNVYGINYVIDPNSSYVELSENIGTIDYLQFPHQTLFFRGGDCDDLSILYAALLESVGIRTAFITIPGHIFMAFALDMSEQEARKAFYDPAMLVFIDDEAWVPVEITLVKEGFLKAWRIGAKEWADNAKIGNAQMYPIEECWRFYPPAGVPNVKARFALPDEVETINSFDVCMDRYIAREIAPMKERLALRSGEPDKEKQNELGVLFGRYGILNEAWEQFSQAAKSDYQRAWTNLGNIAFLQQDYELAITYYNWALKLDPKDSIALLGVARSHYELENLEESDKAYASLKKSDPDLASQYGYLGSVLGGEGRAWTFAERLTSTEWAEKKDSPTEDQEMYPDIESVDQNLAAASEETGEPEKDEAVSRPEPEPEPEAAGPKPQPEPESDTEPEEKRAAAEPEPEAEPAPKPEPEPVKSSITPEPIIEEKSTATIAAVEPEPVRKPEAEEPEEPPEIAVLMPEDRELKEKEAAAAALEPEPEDVVIDTDTEEPPEIAVQLPEDRELIEKREAAAAREQASEEPEVEPEPAVVLETQPERIEEPEPEPEPKPTQEPGEEKPAPEEPEKPKQAEPPKPAPRPAPEPQPKPEPAPVVEQAPDLSETEMSQQEQIIAIRSDLLKLKGQMAALRVELGELKNQIPGEEDGERSGGERTDVEPTGEIGKDLALHAEDDFFTAASEEPDLWSLTILDSFGNAHPALGQWIVTEKKGEQTDPKQLFAKLAVPVIQNAEKTRYSFSARSTGRSWVGLGVHIYRDRVHTHTGYGAGNSVLIWFTYDPDNFGDEETRLQIYRSYSDTYMELLQSTVIEQSIFDRNHYEIIFNRLNDTICVTIEGKKCLELGGFSDFDFGEYIVFRALDTAEFENVTVEVMQ